MAKKTTKIKPKATALLEISAMAEQHGVSSWELAGIMAATGWAEGKQVSETEFSAAVETFRNRPQGGGRI